MHVTGSHPALAKSPCLNSLMGVVKLQAINVASVKFIEALSEEKRFHPILDLFPR